MEGDFESIVHWLVVGGWWLVVEPRVRFPLAVNDLSIYIYIYIYILEHIRHNVRS